MQIMQIIPFPIPVLTPAPGFPEWAKILVTALSSFAVGVLLEPIRATIQRRLVARQTLATIAREIDSLAISMSIFLAVREKAVGHRNVMTTKPTFDTECYGHAYEKDRSVLYEVPSWSSLKRFCAAVESANGSVVLSDMETKMLHMEFALLADRIRDGLLGRRMKSILISRKLSHLPQLAAQYHDSVPGDGK